MDVGCGVSVAGAAVAGEVDATISVDNVSVDRSREGKAQFCGPKAPVVRPIRPAARLQGQGHRELVRGGKGKNDQLHRDKTQTSAGCARCKQAVTMARGGGLRAERVEQRTGNKNKKWNGWEGCWT